MLLSGIDVTEQKVEHAIGEWLRHSGDRLKAELEKKEKQKKHK